MARAGAFRERAAFERQDQTGALDKFGNPTPAAWAPLVTLWADLRETSGRERIAAGRPEAQVTGTLRIRAGAAARGITAGDRVKIRGATWAITAPPTWADPRGTVLELTIEKGGAT
ncbi:MAG: head-tail adaptor protein [Limimaricola soesokkakensis]|uniref:head-tail adaptor protein n=1 Tax=Limimaricola soesokkakensis TaxID=1343159 RepID=UPI00405A21EB